MCDCIEKLDVQLKEKGYCLNATMPLTGGPSRAIISLVRLDSWKIETRSGKPSTFLASHCPFCGVQYELPEKTDAVFTCA
jgi:hypothetical protein